MSKIDSALDPGLRAVMLSELRTWLPAFLSAATVERGGPVAAASELLRLPAQELQRAVAVHVMLAGPVRDLISRLPSGMRRPATSSERARESGPAVTSGIDWAATVRLRATSSPVGGTWVTRPARRVFDVPENRALAWVLATLEERSAIALSARPVRDTGWSAELQQSATLIHQTRRTAWLDGVPAQWPGEAVYTRLNADRTGFYKTSVAGAARYLRRVLISPTPDDIVDALSDRYFEPMLDWKLFELGVLMRICRALETVGSRDAVRRPLHNAAGTAFARYRLSERYAISVWYQTWPPLTGPSELNDALAHYEIDAPGTRPDIVVQVEDRGALRRAIILELKASASPGYLGSGFSQLLGYLRERPVPFQQEASAWLVAPPGHAYLSKDPAGRVLWVTSADDVAAQVTAAVQAS